MKTRVAPDEIFLLNFNWISWISSATGSMRAKSAACDSISRLMGI
jgi:hypothetical protein